MMGPHFIPGCEQENVIKTAHASDHIVLIDVHILKGVRFLCSAEFGGSELI